MAEGLSWASVAAWRMERQGLAERVPGARAVTSRICGLHAQLASSAELTLWARVEGLEAGAVDRALWEERTLVKTWAMRGTLHLLPAGELALWVGAQGALKPRWETASWRKAFGLSAGEAVAVLDAIRAALDGEPLTRDELADAVTRLAGDARLGEAVRGSWGTMPKLAAFRGDVCFARPAGQKVRFTRPDRWLGEPLEALEPKATMAEVVRRHLAVYGPATREGFARWFGMPSAAQAGRTIAALGDEVVRVSVEGVDAWLLAADVHAAARAEPRGIVRLLPAFDQYVVAAPREGTPILATERREAVYRKQGWLSPVLLVDGIIAGVWRHERKGAALRVEIEPFGRVSAAVRAGAQAEAELLAAFLDGELELTWV